MHPAVRILAVALACLALSGCSVRTYGLQTTGNGQSTTVTGTQVSGSASFGGGRAAFSTGQVPPSGAPGGHAYVSGSGAVWLVGIVMAADWINYITGGAEARPLAPETKILETCSCYQKTVNGE